jgi:hypothetical protein
MGALDSHCTVNGVKTKTEIGMCIDTRVSADASSDHGDAAGQPMTPSDGAVSDAGGGDASADAMTGEDGGGPATPTADCAGLSSGGGDFGATLCNSEGDDDDCKYHVAWTSSPIRRNKDVFFDVTATRLFDAKPATGADVQIEAFLTDSHPTPSVDIMSTESVGDGKYHVGPVQFDQPGKWTVRFHLFQFCVDTSEDSPHGHAAFYVNVP